MILTYANYLGLMTAIDEHTHYMLSRTTIQNLIFKHFAKDGSFIAENGCHEKKLFYVEFQKMRKNKRVRKTFRRFMDRMP